MAPTVQSVHEVHSFKEEYSKVLEKELKKSPSNMDVH